MKPVVVLDTTPLGQLSNPRVNPATIAIRAWANAMHRAGRRIVVPDVADFEVRRELIRGHRIGSLTMLDRCGDTFEYLDIGPSDFRRAAQLWADARNAGIPTSHHHELDCDVLLVAQAESLNVPFIIATSNVAHIGRFAPADSWTNIPV